MLGCRGCRLHRGARHRSPDISRCAGGDVVRFRDRARRSTGRGWESLDFPAGCRCSRRHILDPRPLVEGWNTTRPVADRSARRPRAAGHARHPGAAEQLGLDGLPHGPRRALDAESQCRSLPHVDRSAAVPRSVDGVRDPASPGAHGRGSMGEPGAVDGVARVCDCRVADRQTARRCLAGPTHGRRRRRSNSRGNPRIHEHANRSDSRVLGRLLRLLREGPPRFDIRRADRAIGNVHSSLARACHPDQGDDVPVRVAVWCLAACLGLEGENGFDGSVFWLRLVSSRSRSARLTCGATRRPSATSSVRARTCLRVSP